MIIHSLTWNKERKNSKFLVISNRRSKLIGRTTENVFVLALAQKVSDFLLDLLDQPVSEFIPGKAPYSRGWSDQNSKTIQEERVEKGQFNPRIGGHATFLGKMTLGCGKMLIYFRKTEVISFLLQESEP